MRRSRCCIKMPPPKGIGSWVLGPKVFVFTGLYQHFTLGVIPRVCQRLYFHWHRLYISLIDFTCKWFNWLTHGRDMQERAPQCFTATCQVISLVKSSIDPDSMYSICRVSLQNLRSDSHGTSIDARRAFANASNFSRARPRNRFQTFLKRNEERRWVMGEGAGFGFFQVFVWNWWMFWKGCVALRWFSKLFVPDIPQTSNPNSHQQQIWQTCRLPMLSSRSWADRLLGKPYGPTEMPGFQVVGHLVVGYLPWRHPFDLPEFCHGMFGCCGKGVKQ